MLQDEYDFDDDFMVDPNDPDLPRENHLLTLRVITLSSHAALLRAVRAVCTAITCLLGHTAGYYLEEGDTTMHYVVADDERDTAYFSCVVLWDHDSRWVVMDALLRIAPLAGYTAEYISLDNWTDDVHSWAWPSAPSGFHTRWASRGRTHVLIIESGGRSMLVLTSWQQRGALSLPDLRGGHLVRPHAELGTTNAMPPELRRYWIFSASRLRVGDLAQFRAALAVACWAAGCATGAHLFFDVQDTLVNFYMVGRRGFSSRFIYITISDVITRVVTIDVLFRTAQQAGIQVCCMALDSLSTTRQHWPASGIEGFHTRWARLAASPYVMILDYMADTIVMVFSLPLLAIDCRGGAPRLRAMDVEGPMLEPRKRMRRVVLYLSSHFGLPEILFVERHLGVAEITACLPEHFASHESWITARIADWTWSVVVNAPVVSVRVWDYWLELVDQVLGRRSQLYLGYRATRRYGVLVRSFELTDFLAQINAWVSTWVPPTFVWNAIGFIRHKDISEHVDRHNTKTSIAVALSSSGVWLRVRSVLSRAMVRVSMKRRPVLFDPTRAHSATAVGEATTLVLYCTSRAPRPEHLPILAQMGFRHHPPADVPLAQPDLTSDWGPDTDQDSAGSDITSADHNDCGDIVDVHVAEAPGTEEQPTQQDHEVVDTHDDDLPLTALVQHAADRSRSPRRFAFAVSPTLPFVDEDDVTVGSLR
eukprot:237414-Amphidinium_carterae.1